MKLIDRITDKVGYSSRNAPAPVLLRFLIYATIKKGEIIHYRIEQIIRAFAEDLDEIENEA